MAHIPNILTIAGSDSGGGAGIQADIKTIMALGGYGVCAITALTAQNGCIVAGIEAPAPEFVALQLKTVLDGFKIAAAKTGMLFSASIMQAVAPILQNRDFPLVADPVSVSQSGCKLLEDSAIKTMLEVIVPGCDLLTPNIPEAEELTGLKITDGESAFAAAERLVKLGARAVLLKGGHMGGGILNNDYFLAPGEEPEVLSQPHIETGNNHGTGCTLSAAIACNLGHGLPLKTAIKKAQAYLNAALRRSYAPGRGSGPVNHCANLKFS